MIVVHKMNKEGIKVYYEGDSLSIQEDSDSCKDQHNNQVLVHRIAVFKRQSYESEQENVVPRLMPVVMTDDDILILSDGAEIQVEKPHRAI